MSFTFKKQTKPGGLIGMVTKHHTIIKWAGKECGYILEESFQVWKVYLMVMKTEDDKPENCDWKWVSFKNTHLTEEASRIWLIEKAKAIFNLYNIKCAD